MREAVLTVADESALGLEPDLAPFEAADIVDVEVLSCEGGRGVARIRTREPADVADLSDSAAVSWVEEAATSGSDHAYLLEFDATVDPETVGACSEDILTCEPIDVSESGLRLGIAGSQDAIAETLSELEDAGATVGLETLRDYEARAGPLDALTERQREVLDVARDLGYFDVPREATSDDVAAELDIDDSTVTEHLQRAERNLVTAVMDEPA